MDSDSLKDLKLHAGSKPTKEELEVVETYFGGVQKPAKMSFLPSSPLTKQAVFSLAVTVFIFLLNIDKVKSKLIFFVDKPFLNTLLLYSVIFLIILSSIYILNG